MSVTFILLQQSLKAYLHFSGLLTPATAAAKGMHQPVWNGSPLDVVLMPYLCSQPSSSYCKACTQLHGKLLGCATTALHACAQTYMTLQGAVPSYAMTGANMVFVRPHSWLRLQHVDSAVGCKTASHQHALCKAKSMRYAKQKAAALTDGRILGSRQGQQQNPQQQGPQQPSCRKTWLLSP